MSIFGIPLLKDAKKNARFRWKGNLYEFLRLCFGPGPAFRTFTKLLKIPKVLLRQINVIIIIFLDDMPLLKFSVLIQARETLVSILQKITLLKEIALHKIYKYTDFYCPVFSRIRIESTILSFIGRIRVSENPYTRIFCAVF